MIGDFTIQDEVSTRVYFRGSYPACKQFIRDAYSSRDPMAPDYGIVSSITGRFVSFVLYKEDES